MTDTAAYCERVVREQDPDRYFSVLFAPVDRRPHLFALYAFNAEIARVRDSVSEPAPGEIRLTWWREVLEGQRAEEAAAHPVASAIRATIAENRLPFAAFDRMIDARVLDLYDDPVPTVNDLEGYAGDTSSALIRLATIILAKGSDPGGADAAGHAGVGYAVAGLLRSLPYHAQRGQVFVPAEVLARHGVARHDLLTGRDSAEIRAALGEMRALARRHIDAARAAAVTPAVAPAFLPVAIARLYLDAMDRRSYAPFRQPVEIAQWRKMAAVWLAARRNRPMG